MRAHYLKIAAAVCLSGGAVLADKVEFKNGDVLTGKIVGSDGKSLTIKSDSAGEIKVDLANVKTFSTDEPIELRLKDGAIINQKSVGSDPGSIGMDKGAAHLMSYSLDSIKSINPPPVKWTGSVTAGAIVTRGNTFTDQYHAGFDLLRRSDDDRITASGFYNFGREKDPDTGDKVTSTDNIGAEGKYDHFLRNTKWYLFGNALVLKDRIQDLNLRFIPGVGVGYQWVETPALNFNTEAGLSWIYEDYSTQDTKQEIAARLAYHLDKAMNDWVKFINNLEYIPTLDGSSFLVNADAGVRADLTKALFLEAKVEWTYNSQPAPDKSKDDLRFILGVGWKF